MLNYLWGFMLIVGIVVAAFNGKMSAVSDSVLESAKEAINLCVVMFGVVGMWNGIMGIAEKSGLTDKMARGLKPVIGYLFPGIPKEDEANQHIATNMIANMLGLGWAATPSGLKAMEALNRLNHNKDVASNEMCMFMIINISSLQLIPVNMIAYRAQYGSVSPTQIIVPGMIATVISTIAGVLYGKIRGRWSK